MKKNIALIGMSGTLKTTVSRTLAKRLEMLYLDTDSMIEFETSRSIPEIFHLAGETYFRNLESKLIFSLEDYSNAIISTGGGVVMDKACMRSLKKHCLIIWLKATPRTIFYRLKNTKRPRPMLEPFSLRKVEELAESRESAYKKFADVGITTDFCNARQIVDKIIDFLRQYAENEI